MSWCGYIDVLGTKELADSDLNELRLHMERFHTALKDNYPFYRNGTCVAASDGAFFHNPKFSEFYPFFSRVRNVLIDHGVFFKASYIPGHIEVDGEKVKSESNAAAYLHSLNFSGSASEAYQAEARLRGIGCAVTPPDRVPSQLIANIDIRKEGSKIVATKFYDFKLSTYEVGSPTALGDGDGHSAKQSYGYEQRLVDRIFFYASLASINSDSVSAKYASLLVNVIRSSNFKGLRVKHGSWDRAPYILRRIVDPRSGTKGFTKLPGLKFVLLTLYDEMHQSSAGALSTDVEDKVVRFISRRKDCQSNLGDVPPYVLSPSSRSAYVKALARLRGVHHSHNK